MIVNGTKVKLTKCGEYPELEGFVGEYTHNKDYTITITNEFKTINLPMKRHDVPSYFWEVECLNN